VIGAANKSAYPGSQDGETAKILSILRSPMPAPLVSGVGISDLHRIVTGHQTQLDTLVDRIANVLASMHADLQQDVRSSCRDALAESGMGAFDFKLKKLESEVKTGFEDCREARNELRSWLEGRVDTLSGQIATDIGGLQLHLSQDACGLHERLSAVETELIGTDEAAPPRWRLGLDRACDELRQEMRLSVLDNHFEARILALEQQQRQGSPLVAEIQNKLQGLEISLQRQGIAFESIIGDVQHLRQTSRVQEEFRIRQSEAREASHEDLHRRASLPGFDQGVFASMRSRIETIEQRCDATQEKLESTSTAFQQLRCSVANNSEKGDQGLKAIHERVDALAASSSQLQHHIPVHVQRVLGDLLITQRMEEVSSQVDSLAAVVLRQDSRNLQGNLENKRFRELEAEQAELASSLAELQSMVEQFVGQLLEVSASDKAEHDFSIYSKPPRPHIDNSASSHKSSGSKQKQRDAGSKYAEELPKKLELIAGALEGVDDLVQRVCLLEERFGCEGVARSLDLTPVSNEGASQANITDRISADLNQLCLRLSTLEQNLKDDASSDMKAGGQRDADFMIDIVERVRELENAVAKGDKSLELTQSFSMFDRDRLAVQSGGELHALEERISELENGRLHTSSQMTRDHASVPSKEDFSRLVTKVNDFEYQSKDDFSRLLRKVNDFEHQAKDDLSKLQKVVNGVESQVACVVKDSFQASKINSRVDALDAKLRDMISQRDAKTSDDQIRGIVPRIELLVPRIEALEKDFHIIKSEDICQLKQDLEQVHETSDEWRRQFAARTENAVSSLQKQLMSALTGMASPSVMSSARSARRPRSGSSSCEEREDQNSLQRQMQDPTQPQSLLSRSRSPSTSRSPRSGSDVLDKANSLRTWVKSKRRNGNRDGIAGDTGSRSRSSSHDSRGNKLPPRSRSRSSSRNSDPRRPNSRSNDQDYDSRGRRKSVSSREEDPRSPSRSKSTSRSRSISRSRSASRSRSTSRDGASRTGSQRSHSSFAEETRLSLRSWGKDRQSEVDRSPGQNCKSAPAEDILGRLKVAEDNMQDLFRALPRSASARRDSAIKADDMLAQVNELASRVLAPVVANSVDSPMESPTQEMKERVENLLRGKVVARILLRRLRRLQPVAQGRDNLAARVSDAERSLESLKGELRECLEQAMLEFRARIDEILPPSEDSSGDDQLKQ